jgi:RNase P subunit RPR2
MSYTTNGPQREASLWNRFRSWLSVDDWERVRCHECGEDRLVCQEPILDRVAPAQKCGGCGSPSLWPIERQASAAFCPGCEHDLLHQEDASVDDVAEGVMEITCQYCGTPSGWMLDAPAPIRVDVEKLR